MHISRCNWKALAVALAMAITVGAALGRAEAAKLHFGTSERLEM